MFEEISPMTARGSKKLDEIWENPDWICEEKIDGSRYILQFDEDGKAKLTSRRVSSTTHKHVDKTDNLWGWLYDDDPRLAGLILDGEIVVNDNFPDTVSVMGSSPEKALKMLKAGTHKVKYIVYDILMFEGEWLTDKTFEERTKKLDEVVDLLHDLDFNLIEKIKVWKNEEKSFQKIVDKGGEGVILKHKNSLYNQGCGCKEWVKVKKIITEDGIIIGMREGTGKYKNNLGALIIGQYFGDELKEVCTISGMTDEQRTDFWKNKLQYKGRVVEFKAQQKTKSRYRHPVFVRMRDDKSPEECRFNS